MRRRALLPLVLMVAGLAPATLRGQPLEMPQLPVPKRFPRGTRVEVDGVWNGETLEATKLVIEEPDPSPEIKGFPDAIDVSASTISLPPFTIVVTEASDIDDAEDTGDSYRLEELQTGWRIEVEGELVSPFRFVATQINVETRPKKKRGLLELEGFVSEELRTGTTHTIVVLGVPCLITADTELPAGIFRKGRRRIVDDDEQRPAEQLVLFDRLTVGGAARIGLQYRDDYDLDENSNEDRFNEGHSFTLELLLELTEKSYVFAKGRTAKDYVIFDEDDDQKLEERTKLEELNLLWEQLFGTGLAIQIGRQDFDEPREWLYDENLDALRVFWRRGNLELEYSYSKFLNDAPRDFDDRENQIGVARYYFAKDSHLAAYFIDIQDGSDRDDSPFFLGLRALGQPTRAIQFWFDYAYVDGVDGPDKIEGHGGDVGAGYQFRDVPLQPYVYGSYAYGSGDGKSSGRRNRNFRQTGYQDNNDKFFGVASFRYYGELFRPELSNLHILTVGVGVRPVKWMSVDLLYHGYRQDHRDPEIRRSRLRQNPDGTSRDIGQEIDLVFGLDKIARHLDVELDVGYFIPGHAFAENDHPALWVALQLEWNF